MFFTKEISEAMEHLTTTGAFLTVKGGAAVNTMTISWGYIGLMWAKPIFIAVVRPQRHTKSLLDVASDFTVSVPYGTMQSELDICGTKTGADTDKGAIVSFIPARGTASPIVAGCDMYFECAIKYADRMNIEKAGRDVRSFYNNDCHFQYFGEITKVYGK